MLDHPYPILQEKFEISTFNIEQVRVKKGFLIPFLVSIALLTS